MKIRPRGTGEALSRRRFVTLLAAGSAALAAAPALPAARARTKPGSTARHQPPAAAAKPATAASASTPSALQKEFDRQHAGTLTTLKTLRAIALPPGGDLPLVFRPLRSTRRGR